jgi:4a-hydroxytetrahydrobiopterin dehydratase
MNNDLLQKKCVPCEGGVAPLVQIEAEAFMKWVDAWTLAPDIKKISKEYKFNDFKDAMVFVNKVADVANAENHHPDIYIYYNKVKLELTTHAINGLSQNDFIVAAKADAVN